MAFELHSACAEVSIADAEAGFVKVQPRRRKVALVGFASNTLHLVPWFDPEFEIWSMNQAYPACLRRADRWFEMHLPEYTADVREPDYLKFLSEIQIPVYMTDVRKEVPWSVRYPIERAIEVAGRDYFTSTVPFMMAIAMMEGFEEIHLYGINLAIGDEYYYQKACAEWWIGLAQGRGIKVVVPGASALLKQWKRYGYSPEPTPGLLTKQLLTQRIKTYREVCQNLLNQYHTQHGAMQEAEAMIQAIEGVEHGADLIIMAPPPASTST